MRNGVSHESAFRRLARLARSVASSALTALAESDRDPLAWERVEYSEGQGGTAPRQLDRTLERLWRLGLSSDPDLPLSVFGEEADDSDFDAVPEGGYIAVVDPLDGTTNWVSLGIGSAMSVVVYRKVHAELLYVGVSVIQVNWRRHWWAEPTATWRGSVDGPLERDEQVASPRPVRHRGLGDWVVAGVGAGSGPTRELLDHLTRSRGIRTVTLGGVPLGPEVLDRELAALVECKETTVFDSAHLMLAANTDAVVGTLDGGLLDASDLRDVFLRVRLAKDLVVPPYVVAKTETIYRGVVEACAEPGEW